ncbi:hypothetical protein [Methylobacter sp. S3L5C]|uniref:hypothetical protein n=1 Tax=Methylobacter sp. S3L5C TaxID=2839024 RepID=UPI001FADFDB9|nr:hypothetical protein [Methylobacter sp. S3L5C]UOA08610.1 hypothetical protein KKZ03_20870 [Methylobacter sp. S3L5C]
MCTDKNQSRLISSWAYKNISVEEKALICNGAGAAGYWINCFIPNALYGLDCVEAFNIHDYDYEVGVSLADKDRADNNLLTNLLMLINERGGWLKWLRTNRALKYYQAVNEFGKHAFYYGKTNA